MFWRSRTAPCVVLHRRCGLVGRVAAAGQLEVADLAGRAHAPWLRSPLNTRRVHRRSVRRRPHAGLGRYSNAPPTLGSPVIRLTTNSLASKCHACVVSSPMTLTDETADWVVRTGELLRVRGSRPRTVRKSFIVIQRANQTVGNRVRSLPTKPLDHRPAHRRR